GKTRKTRKTEGFVFAGSEDNTWEPEENLDCPDLIAEFLQSQKTAHESEKSEGSKRKAESDTEDKGEESKPKKKKEEVRLEGDPGKRSPRKIPGKAIPGGVFKEWEAGGLGRRGWMSLAWQNSDEADLVPAKEANIKCPQVVISFYEERLTWHSYPSEDDDKKEDKN
ncbi:CBX1 protein, partial [Emberiza fucata]|nr:CBX1 protein [Emberiza fucata]